MTEQQHSRQAPPKASALLETLRGLGYSTATALADIIDNSISAQAKTVSLLFDWNAEASTIRILDDGCGMDADELDQAMRLGEISPLARRAANDLGRFGIGLKTASFSQCRRLTVASRKHGQVNCLRWDLDVLARSTEDGWPLLEGAAEESTGLLASLDGQEHGTLVLWEILDRIITSGFTGQDFLDFLDRVERHLAMVFHRYLEGSKPKLRILINEKNVKPWNPFFANHPATWSSPIESLGTEAGMVEVQCHVLPHQDKMTSQEYEAIAGIKGWTAQQGIYVYRNGRLLVAGSWLGLGRSWTKEEAYRLARIRLDMPNSADADWKIDIRKSTARPPVSIRPRLTKLAEDTRKRARRVFAHRGQVEQVGVKQQITQAWRAEHYPGGMKYRLVETHPAIKDVLEQTGALTPQIRAMLRIIEETLPVQRIWLDTTESRETPRTGFSGNVPAEVAAILLVLYKNMIHRKGYSPHAARQQLSHTEPFHLYPELVQALPDNLDEEE